TFVWASTDSTLKTTFQWRISGDTVWTVIDSAASPLIFNDLKPCTNYEFRLEEICADTTSGFTDVIAFKTDGCCEPPQIVEVTGLTQTFANVSWQNVLAANSYNVLLSTPSGPIVLPVPAGTSLYLSDLTPCTNYGVQVQTVCDTGATDFSPLIEFITLGCGACTDLNYCPAISQSADNEWIANVTLNTLNVSSGSDGGYGNYTGQSTELETYKQYPITLTPGFVGFPFNEWFAAWIDFNQDGDFGDGGEKVFDAGGTSTTTVSGSFFVPGSALPGLTRLRVIMRWDNQPSSSCDLNFNFGEVEDYCVEIVPGTPPNCLVPSGLDTTSVTTTAAFLIWDGVADALEYRLRYRKLGAGGWSLTEPITNSHTLQNLSACTEYEYQVRSTCFDITSDFSSSFIFKTGCLSAVNGEPGFLQSASIQPNPFSDAILLNFNLLQGGNLSVELFDARGQKVHSQSGKFSGGENQVRLERLGGLPAGVYFLKLTGENGYAVRKALKK
ncbi:MAG: GEVED domain-containing protein, partial [Bacteroidota bacterium]